MVNLKCNRISHLMVVSSLLVPEDVLVLFAPPAQLCKDTSSGILSKALTAKRRHRRTSHQPTHQWRSTGKHGNNRLHQRPVWLPTSREEPRTPCPRSTLTFGAGLYLWCHPPPKEVAQWDDIVLVGRIISGRKRWRGKEWSCLIQHPPLPPTPTMTSTRPLRKNKGHHTTYPHCW